MTYDSDPLDAELAARGVVLIAPNQVTRKLQSQDRRGLRRRLRAFALEAVIEMQSSHRSRLRRKS
jgi:hypothetical protein